MLWAFGWCVHCRSLIAVVIAGVLLCATGCKDTTQNVPFTPSRKDSVELYRKAFSPPEDCKTCHPNHYEEWSQSMHAYAMKDPVLFALDSIGQIRSAGRLGQFCIECHSPASVLVDDIPHAGARDKLSAISAHGISCDICHRLAPTQPTSSNLPRFTTDNARRGPIENPVSNSYHLSLYDSRYEQSDVCKVCHNFQTPNNFLIEKTFTEWENSTFPGRGLPCQSCHMKYYTGQAASGAPERERVHHHRMVGVDVPLTDFPGREETIAEAADMLYYSVKMDVIAPQSVSQNDAFVPIQVKIFNVLTGHNIPSGAIFERQMWAEVIAKDELGNVLFSTGLLDKNGDLLDYHSDEVRSGTAKLDTNLVLYNGTAYRHSVETPFFWEADYVENRTIPAFDSRNNRFSIPIPKRSGAEISIAVRLRFRALPPYFLRLIGHPELVEKVPIFEMENFSGVVEVK